MVRNVIESLRGLREQKCCNRSAAWHRIHGRTFKLGEPVTVGNSQTFFGWGVITGNCGENACCGNVRNRFLLEVTYSDGSMYHCLPCEVWHSDQTQPSDTVPARTPQGGQDLAVTAMSLTGEECVVHGLTEDTLVLELRQRLAGQLGQQCWWLLKLVADGAEPSDQLTLREAGLTHSSSACVTVVVKPKDKKAWQWSMASLLQALRCGKDEQIRHRVDEALQANRKYYLTHLIKKVCLAGDMKILDVLLELVPSTVLCQAMAIMRASVTDRYKHRHACVLYHLWEFHFESFKSVCFRLLESDCLKKLHGILGEDLPERMFRACAIKGSPTWMEPLRATSRDDLMALLADPANQPELSNAEFVEDFQAAGFSMRDLEAMRSHETDSSFLIRPERFRQEDYAFLPKGMEQVFLKWTTRDCNLRRRPKPFDEVPEERTFDRRNFDEGFVFTALGVLIERDALLEMAKAIPDGLAILLGEGQEDERLDHAEELAASLPLEKAGYPRQQLAAHPRELRSVSHRLHRRGMEQSEERRALAHDAAEKERAKRGKEQTRLKARDKKQWGRSPTSAAMDPEDS